METVHTKTAGGFRYFKFVTFTKRDKDNTTGRGTRLLENLFTGNESGYFYQKCVKCQFIPCHYDLGFMDYVFAIALVKVV